MESGRQEEANFVYEDRLQGLGSPHQDEVSEDEDREKELEEMLYSQVHFDDSSIIMTPSKDNQTAAQIITITDISDEEHTGKIGFASAGIQEDSNRVRELTPPTQSQFSYPRRRIARYYDLNQKKDGNTGTFVTPSSPIQRYGAKPSNVNREPSMSNFTSKLLERSHKEKIYLPKGSQVNAGYAAPGIREIRSNSPLFQDARKSLECSKVEGEADKINNVPSAVKSQETVLLEDNGSNDETSLVEKRDRRNEIQKMKSQSKLSKKKKQTIEAKISRVLSSLLDEESRSSVEESSSVLIHTSQNLKNSNPDSGWSVGMSWDDMSSKFCFGADSIEEESISSSQMHDGSPTDSFLHSDPPQAGQEIDEESTEPSRYDLNLKTSEVQAFVKPADKLDTDSESEVGSVVEVAPPVRPPPPIVDLSDGEFTCVNDVENLKSHPHKEKVAEITLLSENIKDKHVVVGTPVTVDSSSDDDLIILDILSPSKVKNATKQTMKRCASADNEDQANKRLLPPKRLLQQQNMGTLNTNVSAQLENPQNFVDNQSERALDRWLYNPIRSTKKLDHHKLLKNMSDNPSLWHICYEDQIKMKYFKGPKCTNCSSFGHHPRHCPIPHKIVHCHMCGAPGHAETRCTQRMCLRCGKKNNVFVNQCSSCSSNKTQCKLCHSNAHVWGQCPDLWRRYHLTTNPGEIVKPVGDDMIPLSKRWCSNCAQKGHLSHDCSKARWTCESISPFIESYASPNDEESQLEGQQSAVMLLTDANAQLLESKGDQFLEFMSSKFNATIHSSFDTPVKNLRIKGTSFAQEEIRLGIRKWIMEQERKSTEKLPGDDEDGQREQVGKSSGKLPESEDDGIAEQRQDASSNMPLNIDDLVQKEAGKPPRPYSSLPRKYGLLLEFIQKELSLIKQPLHFNWNVRELYLKVEKLSKDMKNKNTSKIKQSKLKKRMNRLCRMLNWVLVGQCGLAEGQHHMLALKALVAKLQDKDEQDTVPKDLRFEITKHYSYIFSGYYREDLGQLVQQFYSDATLVKQFEFRPKFVTVDGGNDSGNARRKKNISNTKPAVQKVIRDAELVLKNLSSRFIVCKQVITLKKTYEKCSNGLSTIGVKKQQNLLSHLKLLITKLCRKFNINL